MLFIKNKKTRKAIVHALYIFCFFTFINYLSSCVDGDGFLISSLSQPSDDEQTLAPDLAINDLTIREMPTNRQSIALSTTVNNIGTESTGGSIVGWYLSTNSVINTNDTLLKASVIFYLSPNGKHSKSTVSTIPPIAGTYYYGACVAPVSNEIVTSNNCSRGTPIIVSPDLIANSVSVSNTNIRVGEELTLSTSISNSETANANANIVTLSWYRSTDSDITSADTLIGSNIITGILIGGSENKSQSFIATSNSGIYYYGACVEHVIGGETNLDNNCSKAIFIEVINTDVAIGELIVSDETPSNNQSITLSTTVSNVGRLSSSASTLRWYRSTDSDITSADTLIGSNIIPILSAKNSENINLPVTAAPSSAGLYYYGACVDAVVGETNLGDNCSSTSIEVIAPNLIIGSLSANNQTPTNGQSITLFAIVSNTGKLDSSASTLRWYRSTDSNITSADTPIGSNNISAVSWGGGESRNLSITAPSIPGTYYYGACIQGSMNINCSPALTVKIIAPDLILGQITSSDMAPTNGQTITLSTTISNIGTTNAGATTLRWYRSTNLDIYSSDTELGSNTINSLVPGSGETESFLVTVAVAGNYYYGACVDVITNEANRNNNCAGVLKIGTSFQKLRPDYTNVRYFGNSVAIDGDYAATMSYNTDSNLGFDIYTHIFEKQTDNTWLQTAKLTTSDSSNRYQSSTSVAIDGDYCILGVYRDNQIGSTTSYGAAYIFKRQADDSWQEQQKITASDSSNNSFFGNSVAIDGDMVVIGASGLNAAYVFERSGEMWTQQTKLTATDSVSGDLFGYSVDINGLGVFVGAPGNDISNIHGGAVYSFTWHSGISSWIQYKITAPDEEANDYFGNSVFISGNTAIIGAYGDDDGAGSAYIFQKDGFIWSYASKLTASDTAESNYFGFSASISGDYAVVGSHLNDDNGMDSGSAYVFERKNGDNLSWVEVNKILDPDGTNNDYFGSSVSISGSSIIIGAVLDDEGGSNSGSVFIFQ